MVTSEQNTEWYILCAWRCLHWSA